MKYIFTLIIAILVSCSHDNVAIIRESDFPVAEALMAEELYLNENNYDKLIVADSLLIGYSALSEDVFLNAYSLPSLAYRGDIARKGRAQKEFLSIDVNNNSHFVEDGNIKLWCYDQLQSTIYCINATQTLIKGMTTVDEEYAVDPNVIDVCGVDSTTLLLYNYYDNTLSWSIFDVSDNSKPDVPFLTRRFKREFISISGPAGVYVLPHNEILFRYANLNIIEKRNMGMKEEVMRYSVFEKPLKPRSIDPESARIFYNDISVTTNGIYCLYVNRTWEDIVSNVSVPVELHVYSTNMQPEARYIINEPIRFISVDEKYKMLYGTSIDGHYYKYRLQ
jgi:hypothetical protein